jgi:hypothetical protein
MKRKALLFIAMSVLVVTSAYSQTEEQLPEFGIELNTCTPDGVVNELKEKWNPKDFWIRQNVIFESEVKSAWKYDGSYCRLKNDEVDKTKCFLYIKNMYQSILKCYRTTKLLCRQNGGYC